MEKEEIQSSGAGGYALRVADVIRETADTCSIVLEIPPDLADAFRYRAGQFVTLRVPFEGKTLTRSYSLASSPDCDTVHKITIKRISDGRISNWINDNVVPGSSLRCMPPGGLFVLNPGESDVVLFAGGSGITPVISILKTALATTIRRTRLVYANRDVKSVIFRDELEALAVKHPSRFELIYRYDERDGFVETADVHDWAHDRSSGEFFVCGPAAFMSTVERGLLDSGVDERRIHIERFISPPDPGEEVPSDVSVDTRDAAAPSSITVHLDGKSHVVPYIDGQTVLVACQAAGLRPPFSCTEAFCGCCMAKLTRGDVYMRNNDFLSKKEVAQGWVLTCQSVPRSDDVEIRYPD